jgi:hypothetical protein
MPPQERNVDLRFLIARIKTECRMARVNRRPALPSMGSEA